MNNRFFEKPILNSPYGYPLRHWELNESGQPTEQIIENRRRAEFITPIPKPKKRKGQGEQTSIVFDEGKGLSTDKQQYDHTAIINAVRQQVDQWRKLANTDDWRVMPAGSSTPTTTRKASSSATPTSSVRTIPTVRSRPR